MKRSVKTKMESGKCPQCLETSLHLDYCAIDLPGSDPVSDPVNHPKHYTSHPSGVECITVVEHMNFNRGNTVKYVWRAGEKGDELEDLKKARWYLDREIQRVEREREKAVPRGVPKT